MSELDAGGTMTSGRTQMLQMQLKAALRDAEEAEKAAELPSLDEARQQLAARLSPLMDARRRALDAQLAEVRAEAQARIEQAHAEATQVIEAAERVAAEAAEMREAERAAAEEEARAAAAEAERVAFAEAARLAAERAEAEQAERVASEEELAPIGEPIADTEEIVGSAASEPSLDADVIDAPADNEPVTLQSNGIIGVPRETPGPPRVSSFDDREDIWRQVPPTPPQREAPLPVAVAAAPAQVVVDAEAFARVFATVLAEVLGQRGIGPAAAPVVHQGAMQPQDQRSSFWTQARHLDVLLLGASALIVMVVLAAWIV